VLLLGETRLMEEKPAEMKEAARTAGMESIIR
jgi:hypothetical protein